VNRACCTCGGGEKYIASVGKPGGKRPVGRFSRR
jgi:hypothetical protein